MKYTIVRDVTKTECPWLDFDLKKGIPVYRYDGCTYQCISDHGVAVTMVNGKLPFFEVPWNAVVVDDDTGGNTCATCSRFELHGGEDKPRCWFGVPATAEHWCLEHTPKQ